MGRNVFFMNLTCHICANRDNNNAYLCHEKMFGFGDEFRYFQCGRCGCLQIAQVPENLSRYYPPHYYSFGMAPLPTRGLKSWLAARRDRARLTWLGRLGLLGGWQEVRLDVASLGRVPLRADMRILDVGCGQGQLLSLLHRAGFRRLLGIDPYLADDLEVVPGLYVRKQVLKNLNESFDFIMLHHVFEHLEDGLEMLLSCRERLAPAGSILLRLPTVESTAWERYRDNWVQLDAPRHLFLHTRESLRLLTDRAGLRIRECWCDSTEFQFWASELYRRGIPHTDALGRVAQPQDHFSPAELAAFRREAVAANKAHRGDQLVVLLTK